MPKSLDLNTLPPKPERNKPRALDLSDGGRRRAVDLNAASAPVAPQPQVPQPIQHSGHLEDLAVGMENYLQRALVLGGFLPQGMAFHGLTKALSDPGAYADTLEHAVTDIPGTVAEHFQAGKQQMGRGMAQIAAPRQMAEEEHQEDSAAPGYKPGMARIGWTLTKGVGNFVFGETAAALSPVTGTLEAGVSRPIAYATDLPEGVVDTAVQIAVPVGVAGGLKKLADISDSMKSLDGASKTFAEAWDEHVNPHQVSPEAEKAAGIIREEHARSQLYQNAQQQRVHAAIREGQRSAYDKVIGVFADGFQRMPDVKRVALLDAIESGDLERVPEALRPAVQALKDTLDQNYALMESLNDEERINYVKNYLPHIFEDSDRARAKIAEMVESGQLSAEGAKSFLKDRVFKNFEEARKNGFKPVSTNPVVLTLIRTRDVGRYVMANRVLRAFHEQGLAKWVAKGEEAPHGFKDINDKISSARYTDIPETQTAKGGRWVVHEDAARLMDRYFSPGLFERTDFIGSASRSIRLINNFYSQAQLGFSAFHVGFVTLDSITSTAALAAKEISEGVGEGDFNRVVGGLGRLAASPASPVTLLVKGSKLKSALKKITPEDVYKAQDALHAPGSDLDHIVQGFIRAGAIADRPDVYSAHMAEDTVEAFRNTPGRVQEHLGAAVGPQRGVSGNLINRPAEVIKAAAAALKGPAAAIAQAEDTMMGPIFQQLVPRMKMGVFYQHADAFFKAHPEASYEDVSREMGRIWDSVENRLGEMDLDRRFWNQTYKDVALLSMRAVGWNYGTLHELGGGSMDTIRDFREFLATGKMSYRMSYIFGLSAMTGVMGAAVNYINTGQPPKEMRDYVFPADGHGGRYAMPTYAKDVYEFAHHPEETLANKAAPIWSTLYDVAQNKDYYGATVYDPRFPWYDFRAMKNEAEFMGQQLEPFSISSYEKTASTHGPIEYLMSPSFWGAKQAPMEYKRGPAATRALEFKRERKAVKKMHEEGRD